VEGEEAALGPRLQRLHHARLQGPPAHQVTIFFLKINQVTIQAPGLAETLGKFVGVFTVYIAQ